MAQQPPRRDPGHPSGRDNERNNREEDEDEADDESGSATPQRRGRRAPANKLNMYMRAVAVIALLIIGGVGVYKGRNMLSSKESGPKIAKVKDSTKFEPVDNKPTEVQSSDAKGSGSPKSSGFTANTGSSKPGEKSGDSKKTGALFAALNKEKEKKGELPSAESAGNSEKNGAEKKKPGQIGFKFGGKKEKETAGNAGETPSSPKGSQYKLSDPVPAVDSGEGYVADGNPGDTEGYQGAEGYGATTDSAVTADSEDDSPRKPAARLGGYSLNDDSASTTEEAVVEQDPPAEAEVDSDPIPTAPTFGATGGFGSRGSLSGNGASSGSLPKNSLPSSTSRLGQITDAVAEAPPAEPVKLLPGRTTPRPLTASPRERALPVSDATGESYSPANDDVTPITSPSPPIESGLTGLQTPSIAVEKFAPDEVQVGKAAKFEIVVRNTGKVPAYDVTVQDEVPLGTRFQQAAPQPSKNQGGGLVWKLGVIEPGQEKVIELYLVPEKEGEIGSVAQVTFQSKAASKSIVTQPRLQITHDAPPQVHAGEIATVRLTITNSGTGAAANLVLASEVPEGFTHEAGNSLETKVNPLRPGESTQINLVMKAVKAGQYQQAFAVEEEDGRVVAQDAAEIEIVAPGLDVAIAGPKKRYVERQATHNITIANPGTASARDVDLVAYLPRGFKFVAAAPAAAGGQYDAQQHAVVWGVEELVAGASATVQLTTLPVESGDQKVRVEARSATGLAADFEQLVAVDAVSELPFTIHDLADPIEIGSETAYEIRLANRGAKDATNVAISVTFPRDLKPIEDEGAPKGTVVGDRVEFDPISRIAPGQEVIFKVRAEGLRAGDHRIAVSLTSDEQQQPLTREESTRVYSDQ